MFRRNTTLSTPLLESRLAQAVPAREMEILERIGTEVRIAAGRRAMVEDGVGRECMVIADGSFIVERNGECVAELGAGDFMGEVALLTSRPRNATVTATEDSTVYAFSRREFSSLLAECPSICAYVIEAAGERTLAA